MATDYRKSKPIWTRIKSTKNSTEPRWQVTIRIKVEDGTDENGHQRFKTKRISRTFTGAYDTSRKRKIATDRWIAELEERDLLAEEELERRKAEREKQEAEAEAAKIAAIEAERPGRRTVSEYVGAFIDTLEKMEAIERHTVRDYRTIAGKVTGRFAETPMEEVTTKQVQGWVSSLRNSGLAASTIIKSFRVIHSVFKHAVKVRDIEWDPCAAVKLPKKGTRKHNSLTTEGFARLCVTLAALEPSQLVTSAAIALCVGAREGEVCALRWSDYDPNASTLTIQQSIGKDGGKTYLKDHTKTVGGTGRRVPVLPYLATMLERRRIAMVKQLEESGITLTEEEFGRLYITGYIDGRYYSPLHLCKVWREFAESFGLTGTQNRPIRYHDLRHSFASVTIAAGADVRSVSAILGHSSPSFTLDQYGDALPEAKRFAAEHLFGIIETGENLEPFAQLAEVCSNN